MTALPLVSVRGGAGHGGWETSALAVELMWRSSLSPLMPPLHSSLLLVNLMNTQLNEHVVFLFSL